MNKNLNVQEIYEAIHSVLQTDQNPVALHEPHFEGNEWDYVKECLDTGWVSSVGKFVDQFEIRLAEFVGVKKAVVTVNGTAALHMCLLLAGVQANDEVLVPALTFIATANAVRYCGAIPHFADSEYRTLGLDPYKLREYLKKVATIKNDQCYNKQTKRRIKAVVPMHTFGHPVDLDPLLAVCEEFHLVMVEDAAESLGSYYKGQHTGTFGKLAALSFNGNKIVTTGGGGAILTNDEQLARRAKHLTTTAKVPHPYLFNHDETGYNYRMPNINAALGCAQLEKLECYITQKRGLAERYAKAFANLNNCQLFVEQPFAKSNYWLNVLKLEEADIQQRNRLIDYLHEQGIMVRPVWTLMNELPMYSQCPAMNLNVAEHLQGMIINLPSSVGL